MLIYDVLWCFIILLSGFILLFSRICWKIGINRYIWGAGLDLVRKYVDLVRKYEDLVRKYVEGERYKS